MSGPGEKHGVGSDGSNLFQEALGVQEALGERYQAIGRLGAGAFADVYRERDQVLGRDVAIKRIRLDAFAQPSQLEQVKQRFLREAQVAARLRHANIVTTHAIRVRSQHEFHRDGARRR